MLWHLLLPNSGLEVGQRLGRHLGRGLPFFRILLDGGHPPFLRVLASHGPPRPGDDMPSTCCRTCRAGLSGEAKEGEARNHRTEHGACTRLQPLPLRARSSCEHDTSGIEVRAGPGWRETGNGGTDPYSSLYIIPNNSPHNPFPHSLLRTRQENVYLGCAGVDSEPRPVGSSTCGDFRCQCDDRAL